MNRLPMAAMLMFGMAASGLSAQSGALSGWPKLRLWVWERPSDMRFLDPAQAAVAYLALTVRIHGDRVDLVFRRQPLEVPAKVHLMAVIRIEVSAGSTLEAQRRAQILRGASSVAKLPQVEALQVDFDARSHEREGYRALLSELRKTLPTRMPLSMTALASWASKDPWYRQLPVDEVVPMFFRMGPEGREVRRALERGGRLQQGRGALSWGLSLDEPGIQAPPNVPVYFFSNVAWTPVLVGKALRMVH